MTSGERPWWRDMPTVVAVVGLFITLSFNTAGVWMQLGQSKQARQNAALGLLTQLNGLAHQAERQVAGVRDAFCSGDPAKPADRAVLIEAAQNYDYLAWLFNDQDIQMPSARRYWASSMITTYELVAAQDNDLARRRFANLHDFKFATPKQEWPPRLGADCPGR